MGFCSLMLRCQDNLINIYVVTPNECDCHRLLHIRKKLSKFVKKIYVTPLLHKYLLFFPVPNIIKKEQ